MQSLVCSGFGKLISVYLLLHLSFLSTASAHYCQSCPQSMPGMINVHIVSHTHLDTGWTNTYDQYYYRYIPAIYNSVVHSLSQNPQRRFIVVESSFFSRWYKSQSDAIQQQVQRLVRTGQMEFISGGWSMNDEAVSHYSSIIDNLSLGIKWLNETFGKCGITKTGWQIDPFGHSREQASLFAQMGFNALFLGRIDYQDKELRERMKTLEFIWKSSPSIGDKCDLFTGVLPNVYWPPKGFCFDINCFDETLNEQNVMRKAREFIKVIKNQKYNYATNHTIITMGMDFYYQVADKWFSNLDVLIDAVNSQAQHEKVFMFYSTPSCYVKSLNELKHSWPVKLDDFFPYADAPNAYWTGYFTSRPSLKYAIKKGANILQASNQLNVLALKGIHHANLFREMKETLGILQHHDAVTGTCKQYVNDDYQRMLSSATDSAEAAIISSYLTMTQAKTVSGQSTIGFCRNLNISQCHYTELIDNEMDTVVSIYSPIAHPLRHFVRLPVQNNQFKIIDHYGMVIPSQLVPIHAKVLSLKERNSLATHELVFLSTLDPLGMSSYLIRKSNDYGSSEISEKVLSSNSDILLHNGKIGIVIDGVTGFMKEVQLTNGENIPLVQSFWYYQAAGLYSGEKPSGAYAFNPSHKNPYVVNAKASYKIYRGPLVDEVHQVFSDWCTQIIRLYKNYNYIEFDWVIGPIPTGNSPEEVGLEIITRYETNFQNKRMFYTDANGRETIRRIRDFRPTWELQTEEEVASNYYPVTSWVFLRDLSKDLQMTILTDRSQGGSSMLDGSLEIMLHRRLHFDDGYGMEEALNEPGHDHEGLIVRGKHRLIVDRIQESVRFLRKLSKTTSWNPVYLFRNAPNLHSQYLVNNLNFMGTFDKLPVNIHLLSLEQWNENQILIRLEHFYEINEDFKYSRETQVKLNDLFSTFTILNIREMNLAASEELYESERSKMKWIAESNPYENYTSVFSSIFTTDSANIVRENNTFIILMKPMQIRTFLIRVRPRI